MRKVLLAITAALAVCCTPSSEASPKREFRSTWMAGMGIDWPYKTACNNNKLLAQRQLCDYLDKLKSQNFNGVCIHVRPRADAYYKSTLEPWSSDFTGTRGKDPGWDPLAFAIEECHKRGLECYAWANPFRLTTDSRDWNTPLDNEWRAKGWLIKGGNGSWTCFNPGLEDARRHCLDVLKEIYTNYDIDGMLFDDYFYPSPGMPGHKDVGGKPEDGDDYQTYKDAHTSMSLNDWRRNNVNTFVQAVYDEIQAVRPDMRFGIGPAGVGHASASRRELPEPSIESTDWQYDKIFSDCLAWLADGTIDFISPQIYWSRAHAKAPYAPLCDWWSMVADHYNRHCYVSVASYKAEGEFAPSGVKAEGWAEIAAQIDLCRTDTRNNSAGQIYYNTNSMNGYPFDDPESSLGSYIGEHSYTGKSLVPVVDWKQRVVYPAVSGLGYADGKLTWNATAKEGRAIVRYTVYAIPTTVDLAGAQSADGDGLDAKYLVDVSYTPSFTMPADKAVNHWYAVCVYDGYGYESEPSLALYNPEYTAPTTLISPKEGAPAPWDAEMKWTAVAGANYTLQVSTDPDLGKLDIEKKNLSTTSATINLEDMPDGALCYWQVLTNTPGKLAGKSTVETFRTPVREAAPAVTLLSPSDNEEFETPTVEFRWEAPSNPQWPVESYRLEVAKKGEGFDNPVYTKDFAAGTTSCSVLVSYLGKGNFEWRVVSGGKRYADGVSEVKSFAVTKIAIGIHEPGYEVKTEPGVYNAASGMCLENIWYRSAHSPWDNLEFKSNGSLNRGMVAVGNRVYISGRVENKTNSDIYLAEYDGETGEHIRDINLDAEGKVGYYPCNDVIKDSHGNVYITNLVLGTSLCIYRVNLEDGSLTLTAKLGVGASRADHIAIYGDGTSDSFQIFVPSASGNTVEIYNWSAGKIASAGGGSTATITSFYPSGVSHFGVAPKVFPVSQSQFIVDGSATAPTLYRSGGRMLSSFASATAHAPSLMSDNGVTMFDFDGKHYMLYNCDPASKGTRFALTELQEKTSFTGMTGLWRFPQNGLGGVESSTCSTPVDAVVNGDGVNIYVYSPGNGLAAYRMTKDGSSGVDNITGDTRNQLNLSVSGRTVSFSSVVSDVNVHSISGSLVLSRSQAESIELPAAGAYIVNADGLSRLVIVR